MFRRSNVLAWVAGATAVGFCLAHSAHAAGDPVVGQKKFYTCYGCHGVETYKNAYPDYSVPELRHQNAAYIISALHEYRSGDRPHPTMHAQASSLSDQDIEAKVRELAKYGGFHGPIDDVIAAVWQLDTTTTIDPLMATLRQG